MFLTSPSSNTRQRERKTVNVWSSAGHKVCVCVRERERERERNTKRVSSSGRDKDRERTSVREEQPLQRARE